MKRGNLRVTYVAFHLQKGEESHVECLQAAIHILVIF